MIRLHQPHRRRLVGAVVLLAPIMAALAVLLAPAPRSAARPGQSADSPVTVTLSQSTDLVDGQKVAVTATASEGTTLVGGRTEMKVCRAGVTYTSIVDTFGGNCAVSGQSSALETNQAWLYHYPDGTTAVGEFTVSVGTVSWRFAESQPEPYTVACTPASSCVLVLRFVVSTSGGPGHDSYVSVPLEYTDSEDVVQAGCGGPAEGALNSAGADRMLKAWTSWMTARCATTPGGAPTQVPIPGETGEGSVVESFAAGTTDLVYSAVGYRSPGFDPPTKRPMVPTPVALNATVVAAAGDYIGDGDATTPPGLPTAFPEIRLTTQEVATLIGQGAFFFGQNHGPAVLDRNPKLQFANANDPTGQAGNVTQVLALSQRSAITLYMTEHLDTRVPDEWVASPVEQGKPRGVDAAFAGAQPPYIFSGAINPAGERSAFERAVNKFDLNNEATSGSKGIGPLWVLTDYATAVQLGLRPVSIQNAAGEFVEPTPESIQAGVATMQRQPDGTLAPDPNNTAPGAYPLTMVEYALAPAEPLVDALCQPRVQSQQLLSSWLSYVVSEGQDSLADGFVPLTPELGSEATAAIARVGASATSCASPAGTTPGVVSGGAPTAPAPVVAGGGGIIPGSAGSVGGFDDFDSDVVDLAEFRTTGEDDLADAAEAAADAEIELPPFLGIKAVSEVVSPVALVLIVVLTSLTALATSGRPVPEPVSRLSRWAAAGVARPIGRGLSGIRRRR
jgi:hypothetical protein